MRGFITDPTVDAGVRLAEDLPEPNPADDEAVVAVKAFALNNDEVNLIRRRPDGWRPGQDVAGVVVEAAVNGAGPAVGARVACYLDEGGWAERVAVPAHRTAALDDRVSFEQAATLPIAGITALRALRVGGAVLGRHVLVTGATGGVGQFAVQLAVAAGATVTAHVSRPERAELARALGAHEVVTSLAADSLGPFHLVLDGVGGAGTAQALRRMALGGSLVWYGNPSRDGIELTLADFYRQGWNVHVVGLISPFPEETLGEDLAILGDLVATGRLSPHIGLTLGWHETARALAALTERAVRGKAVLTT